MDHVVYIESEDYNLDTLIQALPQSASVVVIDSWTSTKVISVVDRDSKKTGGEKKFKNLKVTVYHCLLLVDDYTISALKMYVRVTVYRNLYPRQGDEPTCFYLRCTPEEFVFFKQVVNRFCKAVNITQPNHVPKNGFGFIKFEKPDYLPQLLGLLWRFDELEHTTINFARKATPRTEKNPDNNEAKQQSKKKSQRRDPDSAKRSQ